MKSRVTEPATLPAMMASSAREEHSLFWHWTQWRLRGILQSVKQLTHCFSQGRTPCAIHTLVFPVAAFSFHQPTQCCWDFGAVNFGLRRNNQRSGSTCRCSEWTWNNRFSGRLVHQQQLRQKCLVWKKNEFSIGWPEETFCFVHGELNAQEQHAMY